MKGLVGAAVAAAVVAVARGNVLETFDEGAEERWVKSKEARYEGSEWEWTSDGAGVEGDRGARVAVKHKFYGLTRLLDEPVEPSGGDGFVVQYEVRFPEGVTCSGSYLKLLEHNPKFDPAELMESSPYSIMFGPDNCGSNNKVHVIFRQQNPVTGEWQEKHAASPAKATADRVSHLYTLEVRPDNTFTVKVDGASAASGSLLSDTDFSPSFNTPAEIDDPNDSKPADWVDQAKIPDPEATKPDDWDEDAPKRIEDPAAVKPDGWLDDEPLEVADPAASQPEDWDEEDDGVWEAPLVPNPKCKSGPGCGEWKRPMIDNPAYKGKWVAPQIDNPAYKGIWKPRRIANPGFFKDDNPISTIRPIGAVAIEILANDKVHFDSIMIGNDIEAAAEFAENVFKPKQAAEKANNKDAAKDAAKKERTRALEEGGIGGMIQYYIGEATDNLTDFYETNPQGLAIAVGFVVVATGLLIYFSSSGSSGSDLEVEESEAAHKKDDDVADAAQDDDAEEEEEAEEEDEDDDEEEEEAEDEKKGARRRIPKAN